MDSKQYYLMNKNTTVLIANKDKNSNKFHSIEELLDIDYAPFSVYTSFGKNDPLTALNFWYTNRSIPNYRDNKDALIEKFKLNSIDELTNKDYALSLSDQYWLKPVDESVSWDEINYFHRDYESKEFFNAAYGEGRFQTLNMKEVHSDMFKSPNNTLGGQLKKAWVKINGKDYLFKGVGSQHNFEQINEVLTSQICEILEVPFVSYTLKKVHSKRHHVLVSVCECMIDDSHELIPAYEILSNELDLTKTPSDYQTYLKILESHDVIHAKEYLDKMFMLDYILLNEDRHLGNFGVIRNVETLKWESVCPNYDTGRSMNTNITENYWDFKMGEVKCFTSSLVSSEVLPTLITTTIRKRQMDKLKTLNSCFSALLRQNQSYLKLFDEQIEKLEAGLKERVDMFEKAMHDKGLVLDVEDFEG